MNKTSKRKEEKTKKKYARHNILLFNNLIN